ncbi:alanine racemase [Isobaculum melis]|uniref:Alanine racemase n=1 Tax=Isobaculum melis TaxID=142588 RepID=A0A1H9U2I6_9LACT|nr:alanine racemase [Isobaculum melis]SES03374.1 alanine racemase [Isobaculum melis]
MISGLHRHTVAMIEKEAIFDNIQNELERLSPNEELFAVVKANAYGHGAVAVAEIAKDAGASGFCVAIIDEALELREAGFKEPIFILGLVDIRYVAILAEKNISVTASSISWLAQAQEKLADTPIKQPLNIHLAVDSGMGRIGFTSKEAIKEAETLLKKATHLNFEGIFTHFATADQENTTYFNQQVATFNELLASVESKPKYVHTANSATALWHQETQSNLVRFGVAMYGLNPSGEALKAPYPLRPALKLVTEVVHIKQMHQGDRISYGATYEASEGEWIATLPIGYADGWLRQLQGMSVLVNGKKAEIVGRICMDQCMIRLDEPVPIGTEVTLIGKEGEHEITVQSIANQLSTIHYEVVCGLSYRVPRIYC